VIAAIYARKSTDQSDVAADQKSISRQIEHAKAFAAKKGWIVDDRWLFTDDGISGAEFAARPGYVRLLNALKPRPPFGILIVAELSRLGREQLETGFAVKQLSQAGVKIFSYLDDREIALDSPTDKIMMQLSAFAADMEREKARQRVMDSMVRKAKAGYVTGGKCFGYQNVAVCDASGKRSHVERIINEPEAAVVRRIFQLCALGHGIKKIAHTLNAEGALCPRPSKGGPSGWAKSSVRSVLRRRTYVGEINYLQTMKRDKWGAQKTSKRPRNEWVTGSTVRIISDAEWNAAHARLNATAATYGKSAALANRPPTGLASKYLLSGLTRCALCGGSLVAHVVTSRKYSAKTPQRWPYYICSVFSNRGRVACPNGVPLPMSVADETILNHFREVILAEDVLNGAIEDVLAAQRPSADHADARRLTLQTDIRRLETEIQNCANAIAIGGGSVSALVQTLQSRDRERAALQQEFDALRTPRRTSKIDDRRVERDLRRRLAEWRSVLRRNAPTARQMLAELIDGRLTFTPDFETRDYSFEGVGTLAKVLRGIVATAGDVGPLVWRARRESNPRPTGSKPVALSN
jgi:site-specific DNA recombinase